MKLRDNETVMEKVTNGFAVLQQKLAEDSARTVQLDGYAVAFVLDKATVVLEVTDSHVANKLVKLLSEEVSHMEIR